MTGILGRLIGRKLPSHLNILTMEIGLVQIYFPEKSEFFFFATLILEISPRQTVE